MKCICRLRLCSERKGTERFVGDVGKTECLNSIAYFVCCVSHSLSVCHIPMCLSMISAWTMCAEKGKRRCKVWVCSFTFVCVTAFIDSYTCQSLRDHLLCEKCLCTKLVVSNVYLLCLDMGHPQFVLPKSTWGCFVAESKNSNSKTANWKSVELSGSPAISQMRWLNCKTKVTKQAKKILICVQIIKGSMGHSNVMMCGKCLFLSVCVSCVHV